MAEELAANQLNPEEFGESVLYCQSGGAPRPINVLITRTQEPELGELIHQLSDRILVRVAKGANGIVQPLPADSIERSSGLVYDFTGRVVSENTVSYRLEFERLMPLVTGNARNRD